MVCRTCTRRGHDCHCHPSHTSHTRVAVAQGDHDEELVLPCVTTVLPTVTTSAPSLSLSNSRVSSASAPAAYRPRYWYRRLPTLVLLRCAGTLFCTVLVYMAGLLCRDFIMVRDPETRIESNNRMPVKQISMTNEAICLQACESSQPTEPRQQQHQHQHDAFLNTSFLLQTVKSKRSQLHQMLLHDYGKEAFQSMWQNRTTGHVLGHKACYSANEESKVSYHRFRRKLQLKIMEVQMGIIRQARMVDCNCGATTATTTTPTSGIPRHNNDNNNNNNNIKATHTRFVWATGGNSIAAGHGNLYNESYTAFLSRAVTDVFAAIGIEFVARNYGIGGMDSAPQIALCQEAIYGTDADVVSWDFALTDGTAYWKSFLFAARLGLHVNRPAFVALTTTRSRDKHFTRTVDNVKLAEQRGVPTLVLRPEVLTEIYTGIPDVYGLSESEIDKMYGPYARYYKCNGVIEKGSPCIDRKYNNDICPNRPHQEHFHPGWRETAMKGSLLALFLTETLIDALQSLMRMEVKFDDPHDTYADLKSQEDKEYDATLYESNTTTPIDNITSDHLTTLGVDTKLLLLRNKALCKTALLPSQTRYLGILTESEKKGELHGYDTGVESIEAARNHPVPSEFVLTYVQATRLVCDVDLEHDHRDYFYASAASGWTSLRFPNDAELEAFAPHGFNPVGLIVICLTSCSFLGCQETTECREKALREGTLKLEINGEAVVDLVPFDQCHLAKTSQGLVIPPNAVGRYELRAWMQKPKDGTREFKISSIISI